jgi:Arc/MetJ-type ribon-helix-helix transcriptional regulator
VQEVPSSNLGGPTKFLKDIKKADFQKGVLGVQNRTPGAGFGQLTPDQAAFVERAIETGRLQRAEDAVREALLLWEERERARVLLTAAFDEAEADMEAGHYTDYTDETLPQLAAELKREARASRESQ